VVMNDAVGTAVSADEENRPEPFLNGQLSPADHA
jgi:hypothetical protein